ncbi:PREDICTED: antimicrobial protein CAP18-like [Elephantulus edwardii]|uniref:antimicrobial protein CAP18-like n=1 Tax=Elephantulus edwardii TaxID=28737 RepID=UPI0003F0808B|nr:PREDICTED: antimicrobial protein CAP18-like [Elephantulus edwardii]
MGCTSVSVLLLLLLGLTWAEPASLTKDFNLSFPEALELATDSYNNQTKKEEENAFRVLKSEPQPDWDATLSKSQSLSFVIKETQCKTLENLTPEQCPFREEGQVKNCVGLITSDESSFSIVLNCESPKAAEHLRVRRGFKSFLKKLKKKVKKLLPRKPVTIYTYSKKF